MKLMMALTFVFESFFIVRKGEELLINYTIEREWSKREVSERHLQAELNYVLPYGEAADKS